MTLDHAIELLRQTLVLTLLVAAPILLVGLLIAVRGRSRDGVTVEA